MSISDREETEYKLKKTGDYYFFISLFCMLFGAVYEVFSHGVFSFFMIYAFAIPLVGGTFICRIMGRRQWSYPGKIARNFYRSGIAALTMGCIMQGVLEIYGTTNKLICIYWIVGIVFVFIGAGVYFMFFLRRGLQIKKMDL